MDDCIPHDVWVEIVLQFLDARDLQKLFGDKKWPMLPPNAAFVARRILRKSELDWFAAHGIPVTLLATHGPSPFKGAVEWRLNGKHHRDDDLPAMEWTNGAKAWFRHGLLHRDGDLPAIVNGNDMKWYQSGIRIHK